jgi:hypothetical protein
MADWNPYDRHVPGDGDDRSTVADIPVPPEAATLATDDLTAWMVSYGWLDGLRTAEQIRSVCEAIVDRVLENGAPLLAAAERERICQLADRFEAFYPDPGAPGLTLPFADLIGDRAPDTPELAATLAATIADLDGYITRKAEAIAAPVIAAAQEAALEPAAEARADAQRWKDVNAELGRRIAALERRAERAETTYLSTLQLRPREDGAYDIHLVRGTDRGTPGPSLCGIDRSGRAIGYSVGGGVCGGNIALIPCDGCAEQALTRFPRLPVRGSVGGQEMALAMGVKYLA